MLNNYICALDIGSSKIVATAAVIKKGRINSVFFETLPSKGVKKGIVVDSIDLVQTLTKAIKKLRAKSGIKIRSVYANISGEDIIAKHSSSIIPLAERGNKVITNSDIERVIDQARILGSSLEEEIIHKIPYSYKIDSKDNLINPLGLYSHRLEVDLYLICARLSSLESLSRVINQAGLEIKDLFFSGLATSRVVFNQELSAGINLFCDIGKDFTELLLFEDGRLMEFQVLPIGGDNLTSCLTDALKITVDLAEDIKRSYGFIGDHTQIEEDKEILIKKSNLYNPIKQRLVSEIATSEARLICSQIKEAIEKKISYYKISSFIVVGRTIFLEGFIEMLENTLNIPVKIGRLANPNIPQVIKEDSALLGQKYLTYLTSLGILLEALDNKPIQISSYRDLPKNIILKTIRRFKDLYLEYF